MNEIIQNWVSKIPGVVGYEALITSISAVALILIVAAISYFVIKRVFVHFINTVISKTKSDLDDVFVRRNVFNRAAYLFPAWVIYTLAPGALTNFPASGQLITILAAVYLVLVAALLMSALIDSLMDIYHAFPISRQIPIQNFGQVAKLIVYFIALIGVASVLLGESPLKLFAGLGAMTAVLMLVFKDPILGFVAGLQLSYNRMVGIGDWVDIPQHNASGDVLEIGLTTVKVQNFDNTVTTVPTQSLINDSFKNWRGMQESGGRRIKRALHLDTNSIQFCDQAAIDRYSKVAYIKEYIAEKQTELDQYNTQREGHNESLVNGRRLTNVGTFRAYIQAYLENHPNISKKLTLLVRQLAPTEAGLPIEIYAFSTEKNWIKYEGIQADIFDHLLAVAQEFDLRVFQKPSGADFHTLASNT